MSRGAPSPAASCSDALSVCKQFCRCTKENNQLAASCHRFLHRTHGCWKQRGSRSAFHPGSAGISPLTGFYSWPSVRRAAMQHFLPQFSIREESRRIVSAVAPVRRLCYTNRETSLSQSHPALFDITQSAQPPHSLSLPGQIVSVSANIQNRTPIRPASRT